MFNSFHLKNREEVELFEQYLNKYTKKITNTSPNHISLVAAYSQLQERKDGGRVFLALIDLQLSFLLLHYDSIKIGGTFSNYLSKGKAEGGSVLDSEDSFFIKWKFIDIVHLMC